MANPLLDILCCPVTHKALQRAGKAQLQALNDAIGRGEIRLHNGELCHQPIDDALVTEDGRTLYRIDDGIPVLLDDEAIALAQLG